MPKVDKRVAANDTNQVEQHHSREEVLCFKVDRQKQYSELSGRILHAESAEDTKQSTTSSTTPDEDLRNDASVLHEHGRQMLRITGQHTRSEEERPYVRSITFEQSRVPHRKHEVVRGPHIDCQMHGSGMHKH